VLNITRSGNQVILTSPIGALQAAPAVTGTYTTVTAASSPYTNAPGGAALFFRVKIQ
jgi:hypothetical protein